MKFKQWLESTGIFADGMALAQAVAKGENHINMIRDWIESELPAECLPLFEPALKTILGVFQPISKWPLNGQNYISPLLIEEEGEKGGQHVHMIEQQFKKALAPMGVTRKDLGSSTPVENAWDVIKHAIGAECSKQVAKHLVEGLNKINAIEPSLSSRSRMYLYPIISTFEKAHEDIDESLKEGYSGLYASSFDPPEGHGHWGVNESIQLFLASLGPVSAASQPPLEISIPIMCHYPATALLY